MSYACVAKRPKYKQGPPSLHAALDCVPSPVYQPLSLWPVILSLWVRPFWGQGERMTLSPGPPKTTGKHKCLH